MSKRNHLSTLRSDRGPQSSIATEEKASVGTSPNGVSSQPHISFARNENQRASADCGADRAQAKRPSTSTLLSAKGVKKAFRKGSMVVPVLKGVDLTVREGEVTSIIGQSGSGKSTLLHLLGTLDSPDSGEIHFGGRRIDCLRPREKDQLRNRDIGMIFQFYHLLPELSALENVLMPLMISEGLWSYWRNRRTWTERATKLLDMVGLGHRLTHKPRELSGGEMQRAAIARALIAEPKVLLADEPTGNLDRKNGEEILKLLRSLNDQEGLTIVMVTHDQTIARQADVTIELVEGIVRRD